MNISRLHRMRYNIAVIGLNHKTSTLELRESVSFTTSQIEDFLKRLKSLYPMQEFVILSTCNRVEIYIGSRKEEADVYGLISLLASYHNISEENLLPFVYNYSEDEAITHLFAVATGIDSLVVGEAQILGQIKRSYQKALELGSAGKVLNKAFQKAFAVGKEVRTLTKIGEGNISVSSISCQLADEILGGLSEKRALLIGAGKVGALTFKTLSDRGVNSVLVSNRSYEKAKALAKKFNGRAVKFKEIEVFLAHADIVISSTSAPHYILHPDMLKRIINRRNNKPIFLIDLAVPRDIDPMVSQVAGVHLYNIDSLKGIAEQNIKKRESEIFRCRKIIAEEIKIFMTRRYSDFTQEEGDILFELTGQEEKIIKYPKLCYYKETIKFLWVFLSKEIKLKRC